MTISIVLNMLMLVYAAGHVLCVYTILFSEFVFLHKIEYWHKVEYWLS